MRIDGHMAQALDLTHKPDKAVELYPYCAMALLALRPLVFYGQ